MTWGFARAALAGGVLLGGALLGAAPAPIETTTPEPAIHTPASCATVAFRPDGKRGKRAGMRGPGLVLSGAGMVDLPAGTMAWVRAHVRGPARGRAGNVIALRASGERAYTDEFYRDGRFAWVQEILIPPCATRADVDAIASYVADADAVFFAGGDQSYYAGWKGSALIRAVRAVYARGGIVGGGSAGLAIQGEFAYDSVAANRVLHDGSVTTPIAVKDPLGPAISFTTGLFAWPPLRGTLTDTHFAARDRFGRSIAFLARIAHDGTGRVPLYALGVDQDSVVLVEGNGSAVLRVSPKSHGAYLIRMDSAPQLTRGQPLRASVEVAHVARDGERLDLRRHRTSEKWYPVNVDGSKSPPYDVNPYR